jgi:NAD(P)-dependent dehydrogenase (short-subunit alcohol dehydrogenase family)
MAAAADGTRGVLVSGAGKGIGEATVHRLAARGFRVFAGVRTPDDGHRLTQSGGTAVTPLPLDVSDPSSIDRAATAIRAEAPFAFLGLVNNAAVSTPCPLEFLPVEELRALLEVNVVGALALTQALLPELRRAGAARIVNVSSINGRLAQPFIGGYSASKFALEGMSDALRRELRPSRIEVTVIQPGAVDTPIFRTARRRGRELAESLPPAAADLYPSVLHALRERPGRTPRHAIPADRAARVIERALTGRRPRTRYLVGADARLAALLQAALPDRLLDLLLTRSRP